MTIDVFLSHNSKDKPLVREVAKALRDRDLTVWFDEDDLVPGMPWVSALEQAIQNSAAVAVLIGGAGVGPWERPEMNAALIESVERSVPIIPLLLPNAPEKPDLPLFLKTLSWIDCRDGVSKLALDRICKSVAVGREIMGRGLGNRRMPVVQQNVATKTKSSAKDIWSFLSDQTSRRNWITKGCLLLPMLLICFGLGPPWENGTGWTRRSPQVIVTSIVQIIAFTSVFSFVGRWTNADRLFKFGISCCVGALAIYIVAFFSLTEPLPDTTDRVFSGFIYSEQFLKVLEFQNDDYERTKLAFEYMPLRIYVPWTVTLSQVIVVICWLLSVGLFSFYLGVVVKIPAIAESKDQWSADSLVSLELPVRIRRTLYDSHIETIGDLCALNKRQLKEFTRMNTKQLGAVMGALARVGICLRDEL